MRRLISLIMVIISIVVLFALLGRELSGHRVAMGDMLMVLFIGAAFGYDFYVRTKL